MGTGGTPVPTIARIDEAIAKVLVQPEVVDAFSKQGIEIFHMNPQQLGDFLRSEAQRFSVLLKSSRANGTPR
jgi:tripartite-type tricarboxylate transporter receptor subunit TctC